METENKKLEKGLIECVNEVFDSEDWRKTANEYEITYDEIHEALAYVPIKDTNKIIDYLELYKKEVEDHVYDNIKTSEREEKIKDILNSPIKPKGAFER